MGDAAFPSSKNGYDMYKLLPSMAKVGVRQVIVPAT